jgi:hypothetical protein
MPRAEHRARCDAGENSPLFEIALVLVRLDHVVRFTAHPDQNMIHRLRNFA